MLTKITSAAIFFLTFLYPSVASARQWVVLGNNPEVSVDVDSIKGEGDTRTFWSQIVYSENRSSLSSGLYQPEYSRTTTLTFVNCEQKKIGVLRVIRYDNNGRVVNDFDISHLSVPPNLQSVVPDTIGETQLLYICSLRTTEKPPVQQTSPIGNPSALVQFPVLRLGMQGPAVTMLQQRLQALGFFKGSVDGDFGLVTEAAVKAAQRRFRLAPDGVVGSATWAAILR
jgi:Putative peptidoglycan binding domain